MGVPTARVKRINFILSAFLAGPRRLHAVRLSARRHPGAGRQNYELLAITAAVLGGTSLFGGTGTIWGSVIGAFLLVIDPDRARADRRAGLVLRHLHRRDAGRRRHRQCAARPLRQAARHERPTPAARRRSAPAPDATAEHARQVDRSGAPVFELRRRLAQLRPQPGHLRRRPRRSGRARSSALVGDNGAGKSTLLKIFAGYQQPTRRHAPVHGQGRPLPLAGGRPRRSASRPSTRTSPSSTSSTSGGTSSSARRSCAASGR